MLLLLIRPTNRLPTSPLGAGHKGHREAPLLICNFSRIAQATLRCKSRNRLISCAVPRLSENNNRTAFPQLSQPVERDRLLWETALDVRQYWGNAVSNHDKFSRLVSHGREITPRSVRPFTKNCMASATSSSPMILTNIRIPVSPITALTRPAAANTK